METVLPWMLFLVCCLIGLAVVKLIVLALRKVHPPRRCPFCAEVIQKTASLCPHCRSNVAEVPPPAGGWKHHM